jgi:hypothetical protein
MGKIINLYFFYTCNNIISTFLNLEFFLSHIRFFLSANKELQQLKTKNCNCLKILRMSRPFNMFSFSFIIMLNVLGQINIQYNTIQYHYKFHSGKRRRLPLLRWRKALRSGFHLPGLFEWNRKESRLENCDLRNRDIKSIFCNKLFYIWLQISSLTKQHELKMQLTF